jgi:hypothetical protein
MSGIKIKYKPKVRPQNSSHRNVFSFLNSSSIIRMLLQCVWHTVYNRIFRVRQIIVGIYFHTYNRISFGGGFAVRILGVSFVLMVMSIF